MRRRLSCGNDERELGCSSEVGVARWRVRPTLHFLFLSSLLSAAFVFLEMSPRPSGSSYHLNCRTALEVTLEVLEITKGPTADGGPDDENLEEGVLRLEVAGPRPDPSGGWIA